MGWVTYGSSRLILVGLGNLWFLHVHLLARGLEELFFSCAVVSVFGSGGKYVLVLHTTTYVLRVQYSYGVVLVFWFWREIVLVLRMYLVYNTVVLLCSFSVVVGNSSQNENTFLQKNLIGLLYYDPVIGHGFMAGNIAR